MKQDLILEQLIRTILLEQKTVSTAKTGSNPTDNLFGGDDKAAVPINTARDAESAQSIIAGGLTPNNMNFNSDTTFLDTVALENSAEFKETAADELKIKKSSALIRKSKAK
jgi:phosphoribosylanthranilate isomerase